MQPSTDFMGRDADYTGPVDVRVLNRIGHKLIDQQSEGDGFIGRDYDPIGMAVDRVPGCGLEPAHEVGEVDEADLIASP